MRTTLDLPDDLHCIVTSLASHQRQSLSKTAAELMRRGLELPAARTTSPLVGIDPVTRLPLVRSPRVVTPEDVKALDDEE